MVMNTIIIKCKKCRHNLLSSEGTPLLSGHNNLLNKDNFNRLVSSAGCLETENSLYLQESLPDWILSTVNEADWLKGKLICPKCDLRLGSFNFVSGRRCTCGESVLPPIHIIRSKIDWSFVSHVKQVLAEETKPVTCNIDGGVT